MRLWISIWTFFAKIAAKSRNLTLAKCSSFMFPKLKCPRKQVTMLGYLFHHKLSYMLLVGNEGKTERVILFFSEPVEVEEVTQSQGE